MHEQVGEHAAAERPVAAPLPEHGPVERHLRPQRHTLGYLEIMAQEHLPVDRARVHLLPQPVIAPLADEGVAVIAGLGLGHVADRALRDRFVGHEPGGVGHRLHADGHDAVVLDHGIDDGVGLGDGLGHGLFAVDVFLGGGGVDADLGVPVVRRGDADHVDLLEVQ